MDFLVSPLFFLAFVLGALTLAGIVITAWQRDANDVDSNEWAVAYGRTKSLVGMGMMAFAAMLMGSYLESRTPSFHSAYTTCLNATNGEQASYRGTINRQSSCVVIAREVIKSSTAQ
jgi:hypothetical protein